MQHIPLAFQRAQALGELLNGLDTGVKLLVGGFAGVLGGLLNGCRFHGLRLGVLGRLLAGFGNVGQLVEIVEIHFVSHAFTFRSGSISRTSTA